MIEIDLTMESIHMYVSFKIRNDFTFLIQIEHIQIFTSKKYS